VPSGDSLSAYSGPTNITKAGTVISGKAISSCLTISASGVVIQNSRVQASCGENPLIKIMSSGGSATITDTELDGQSGNGHSTGVQGGAFTCLRCNVHNIGEGFNITDNVTVKDSYVHDLYGSDSSHNNAIITNGGTYITITHNNLHAVYSGSWGTSTTGISSALSLFGDFSVVHNVVIQNNLLTSGGGYCTYGGSVPGKAYPHANHIQYIGNQFSTAANAQCGRYGVVADYNPGEPGNVWSGNVWADGPQAGRAISG
jgi:hypothetical protein